MDNEVFKPEELIKTQETNALKWALSFVKTIEDNNLKIDADLMLGWFANAIMCQRDKLFNEMDEQKKILKEALEKYADENNWSPDDLGRMTRTNRGNKWAREALKKCEEL